MPCLLRACLCVFKGWGQSSVGQVDGQMMCLLPVAAVGYHLSESACCRPRGGGHSGTHAWPASPLSPSPGPVGGGPALPPTMTQSSCAPGYDSHASAHTLIPEMEGGVQECPLTRTWGQVFPSERLGWGVGGRGRKLGTGRWGQAWTSECY